MIQLSKEETKRLERESTPLFNVVKPGLLNHSKVFNKWMAVLGWTHMGKFANNSIINKPLHVRVAAMSKLLGFKQNYHVNYWERNAVWGLEHNGIKFVLYISNKGLSVQIEGGYDSSLPQPTPDQAQTIINLLFDTLVDGKLDPIFAKHFGAF